MKPKDVRELFSRLAELDPDPKTELVYSSPFELLVAVILSAQAEVRVQPVASVGIEVAYVAVVPVAVGLQQALEADIGSADRVDRDLGACHWADQGGQKGKAQQAVSGFHGRLWMVGTPAGYDVNVSLR